MMTFIYMRSSALLFIKDKFRMNMYVHDKYE